MKLVVSECKLSLWRSVVFTTQWSGGDPAVNTRTYSMVYILDGVYVHH